MLPSLPANAEHPWPSGHIFQSPGAHLTYRIVGPCCRLYDRDQLPWPCCRLQWRGKEPSWRRIGRRFIVDLSTRRHPSYCVEIVGQGYRGEAFVTTLYTAKLSSELQEWWHTKRRPVTLLGPAEPVPAYAASTCESTTASAVVEPAETTAWLFDNISPDTSPDTASGGASGGASDRATVSDEALPETGVENAALMPTTDEASAGSANAKEPKKPSPKKQAVKASPADPQLSLL